MAYSAFTGKVPKVVCALRKLNPEMVKQIVNKMNDLAKFITRLIGVLITHIKPFDFYLFKNEELPLQSFRLVFICSFRTFQN